MDLEQQVAKVAVGYKGGSQNRLRKLENLDLGSSRQGLRAGRGQKHSGQARKPGPKVAVRAGREQKQATKAAAGFKSAG